MAILKRLSIRMYRGILGDCFLIRTTLDEAGAEVERSILIDCGVLQNVAAGVDLIAKLDPKVVNRIGKKRLTEVEAGPARISAIAKDVLKTVGKRIDLLVITHEHYDHLSGFAFEKGAFLDGAVSIGRLWMAWTENPKDPQASALRARFSKGKQALAAAAALAESDAHPGLRTAAALAAFAGPVAVSGLGASGVFGTAEIMQMLKDKAGADSTSYLEPGQVIDLDEFNIKAFVLGPPRDEALLRKDTPSKGHAKEVYLTRLDAAAAAESTVNAQLSLQAKRTDTVLPFSAVYQRPLNKKARRKEPTEPKSVVGNLYDAPAAEWRRIDSDWTGSIEALALKMDSDTNNTSLALAFELPDGQVLLFPGDAQVGNWLSWNDQTYPPAAMNMSSGKPVTAEDLLRRTTFYKVGHHGSHNATVKALGLERMVDPRLVAAIPVVEAVAAIQGKGRTEPGSGWRMPFEELYKALQEKTKGRIVQGDGNPTAEQQAFSDNPTSRQRPVKIEHNDLFVEMTFDLS
ncbi:MBL fold metallo-hydrolase [Mesorhizobium sp. M0217]|uniref:MBL fold metallo-hydrolase n=1 Tax=unclassified Mesorhizobium TaxID=325217 RepID=UPI00333B2A94